MNVEAKVKEQSKGCDYDNTLCSIFKGGGGNHNSYSLTYYLNKYKINKKYLLQCIINIINIYFYFK